MNYQELKQKTEKVEIPLRRELTIDTMAELMREATKDIDSLFSVLGDVFKYGYLQGQRAEKTRQKKERTL